ncbi:MAG: acyl-CoA carboxylase subunit epsilon [Nocardioidaceae bacterium]
MTDSQPLLRVVNPDATPEEIAALVAVFSALGGEPDAPPPAPRSQWALPARRMRHLPGHGSGAWKASGLPR